MKILWAILFVMMLMYSALSEAQETVSFTIHHFYQSLRAMGMGDAFIAIRNDASSMYYNPASLAFSEQKEVSLSLDIGSSLDTVNFINDINAIQSSGKSENDKQNDLIELITENYGKTYTTRIKTFETLVNHNTWGFGFIPLDATVEASLHQQVGPSVNTTVFGDSSLMMAKGFEWPGLLPGKLGWGFSGKFVNRLYFSQAVSATELAANEDIVSREDISEGYTVDFDLGLLWEPSENHGIGMTARNLLDVGFENSLGIVQTENETDPEQLHRVLDLGYAYSLPAMGNWNGRLACDIRDIGHPNANWKKMSHLGFEMDYSFLEKSNVAMRIGVGELYWSAGFSMKFGFFVWDLASYAENVGTLDHDQESRVYATKFKFIF